MGKVKTDKETICRKALELFLHKGYLGTSLNDISKALSVTKGALYHHFKTKRDLYYQVLILFFEENRETVSWKNGNLRELLEAIFTGIYQRREELRKMVGSQKDSAILLLYSFLYDATREFPEFQQAIDQEDEQRRQGLSLLIVHSMASGEIRTDLDPEMTAFEIEALLQQLIYLSFVNPRIKEDGEFLKDLFENYWKRFLP